MSLPPTPGAPKPGTISGRVVIAQPGRPGNLPVAGADIEVLGTGLAAKSDSSGFFLIEGISSEAGQMLFRADLDEDGTPDRQKLLSLQALKAGVGKQIALGDVVLSENASIRGQVLRDDVSTPSGHGGTTVFVPVGPYLTTTADDGSFTLSELPEGTLSLAFFRVGYAPRGFDNVTVSSGQELTLRVVRLSVETTMPAPAELKGRVVTAEGAAGSGALIVIEGTSATTRREATAGADGAFSFTDVEVGIYSVTASRLGSTNARLLNLLLTGGTTTLPDLVLGPGAMGTGGGAGGGAGGGTGGGAGGGTGGGAGGGAGGDGGGAFDGGPGQSDGGAGQSDAGADAGMTVSPPSAPTNLAAFPGSTQITLTWNSVAGATSYRLYWAPGATVTAASGTPIIGVSSPSIHQALTNGTQYAYVVTALNAGGESPASSSVTATPSASTSTQPPFIAMTRPDVGETGVLLDAPITIRATKPIDGTTATSSTIIVVGDAGVVATSVSAANDTIVVTPSAALLPGAPYQVTVTTGLKDGAGQPLPTPKIWEFTTGSPGPTNLQAELGNSAVTLQWGGVVDALEYAIHRSATAAGPVTITYSTTGVSFTDQAANNGTTYFYRVTARTPRGVTSPSNQVSATPSPARPQAPSGVTVRLGKENALLNWSQVGGATGYTVFRATSAGGPFVALATAYPSTTFLDTGRSPDTSVFYVVQTESVNGRSVFSNEVGGPLSSALASGPANFTATPGYDWARLQWSAVPAATGYLIFRVSGATAAPTYEAYVTVGTSVDLPGLTNGTTYRFFVTAVTNGVLGDLVEATVTPLATTVPQTPVMGLPVARVNRIDLTWSNSAGATVHTLLRSNVSGGPYTVVGTSGVDSSAVGGLTYFYVVRADRNSLLSEYSNEVSATALTTTAPPVPTAVTAEASTGSVQVRWAPVANTLSYEVRTSTTPGGPYTGSGCTTYEPFETQCSFGWTNETPVYLAVRATNGATPSAFSSEATATPTVLGATAGLTRPSLFATGGNSALTLSWYAVVNATSYRVFRRTPTSNWVVLGTTASLTWNDSTVANGTPYMYGLQAINETGPRLSVWDTLAYTTPTHRKPVKPQNLTLTPFNGGVMASWSSIAGASSYSVTGGFAAGSSPSSAQVSCYTFEPYETRCVLGTTNGTLYYVSMTATTPEGISARTDEVQITPAPVGPAEPSATVMPGNGAFTITAPVVPNVTSYVLYRRGRNSDWAQIAASPTPYFTDTAVNREEVRYATQSQGPAGVSRWAFESWLYANEERPTTPQNVSVTGGNAELTFSWAPVHGATTYNVYTAPSPTGPFTYRGATTDPFDTRLTVAATNGTPLSALVVATTGGNAASSHSSIVTATPTTASPLSAQPTLEPGNNGAYVTWPAITGATAYRVFRRFTGSDWRLLATLSSTRLTDFNVQNGENVRYAVQSVNATTESGWNFTQLLQVSDTLPTAPADVVLTPGNAAAQVSWARVPGATSYRISTSTSATGPFVNNTSVAGEYETRARILGLTNAIPIWVIVEALIGSNNGVPSGETTVTPLAAMPTTQSGITATPGATGTVALSWSASTGATSYRVHRRLPNSSVALLGEVTTLSYSDSGLTSGTVYTYYVEPVGAQGSGAWSVPSSVTAP